MAYIIRNNYPDKKLCISLVFTVMGAIFAGVINKLIY